MVLAIFRILRPVYEAKSKVHGQHAAPSKGGEAEDEREDRDRGVRGSIASAPWEENAHAHDSLTREHEVWC